MNAWENRQKSYNIMSQKQSDAILGYERVYDTDTGEIYKAYNGFTDDYQGNRYKSITDNMYTEKTSGYIEKKWWYIDDMIVKLMINFIIALTI